MLYFYQFYTAAASSFGSFLMGLLSVWPSYTMDLYTSPNTTLLSSPMTRGECSLLGSLPSLGAMLGTLVVVKCMEVLGRKKAGMAMSLPIIIAWAIVYVTSSNIIILGARFLSGVTGGAFLVFGPIFISEVAEDSIRGTLASGPVMFYCFGCLISYIMGWYLTYHTIVCANLGASVICLLLFVFVCESPIYLIKQNKEEEARAAIAFYRSATPSSKNVLQEFSRLKSQLMPDIELVPVNEEDAEKEKSNTDPENDYKPKMSPLKSLFSSATSRRAFIVVALAISLQVFMGMMPVQVYAKELFTKAVPQISSSLCSVIFAVILLSGVLVTAAISDMAGRRVLLLTSSALVGVSMGFLGYLLHTNVAPVWVLALTIMVFCFSFMCGPGTVPYVLLAECFTIEVQGVASLLLVELVWFLNFLILFIFPLMTKMIGIHGSFYVFSFISLISFVTNYILLPETKGLSNEQIQEIFSRRSKN